MVVLPIVDPLTKVWVSEGQGTALLLVAACILFAVVYTTWNRKDWLLSFASVATAIFGFLGTSYTLFNENQVLLTVLGAIALYFLMIGVPSAFLVRIVIRPIQYRISLSSTVNPQGMLDVCSSGGP